MRRHLFLAPALALTVFFGASCALTGKKQETDPRQMYDSARSLAERGSYSKASKFYGAFVEKYPGSPRAPEAKFRQAECLELMKDPFRAFQVYQELLEQYPTFPNTTEVLHRQLGIGTELMEKRGLLSRTLPRARDMFRKVVNNAPFGETAPRAQFNLAMTYELRKLYSEAIMEYGKVIANYPGSDVVDDADYHLALCHYEKSEMSPHDQSAAAKALTALKGFLKRYPANPKSVDAKEKMEKIAGRKARALFEVAEFYERTGSPKSALYYYQEIIDEYPELELARRSELKIRRDFELAQVDRRIEELEEELETAKEEAAYSRRQIRKLRRPDVQWHVWKWLRTPGGAKGERIAQERERLKTLVKEAAEKKGEIRKVVAERREMHRLTSAQLKVDRARRENSVAQMTLAAARDDRPGPSKEGEENAGALKAYERDLSRKRARVERTARAVSRAEERLEDVRARVDGEKGRKESLVAHRARERKKSLRDDEFRKKLADLNADLAEERRSARALAREEKKQQRLVSRLRRKAGADELAEAEAGLSLISARRDESLKRAAALERDIERRKRIHELERRYAVALRNERRAEAALHHVEAVAHEGKKGFSSWLRGDPLTRAVDELDLRKGERVMIEKELSALTSGKEYISLAEKRRAEKERLKRERAEARERERRKKEEFRRARAAEREKKRIEKNADAERRVLERIEAEVRARREKEESLRAKAAESQRKKEEKEAELEARARERARAEEAALSERRAELQERLSEFLGQEELARARLEEARAAGEGGVTRQWLFFRSNPVRKAEKNLERLRTRREALEEELDRAGGQDAAAAQ